MLLTPRQHMAWKLFQMISNVCTSEGLVLPKLNHFLQIFSWALDGNLIANNVRNIKFLQENIVQTDVPRLADKSYRLLLMKFFFTRCNIWTYTESIGTKLSTEIYIS